MFVLFQTESYKVSKQQLKHRQASLTYKTKWNNNSINSQNGVTVLKHVTSITNDIVQSSTDKVNVSINHGLEQYNAKTIARINGAIRVVYRAKNDVRLP